MVGAGALEARHIVTASGAEPRRLDIPGEDIVRTSTDFLDLDTLPARIVLVGAGYIAFELAHIARRAGSYVTILGRSGAAGNVRELQRDRKSTIIYFRHTVISYAC